MLQEELRPKEEFTNEDDIWVSFYVHNVYRHGFSQTNS